MPWIVEDGKEIHGGLSAFYKPEELRAGMRVRVWRSNRRLAPATIERVHTCWYDWRPVGFADPNGRTWEQCAVDRAGNVTSHMWTLTDDGTPITDECSSGSTTMPTCCIHVRYKNGKRAVVPIYYVRPPDVLGELASI